MIISQQNWKRILLFNIIRFICSYTLIFKIDWDDIVKTYILFFSGGLDDIDSRYPFLFNLYNVKKKYRLPFPANGTVKAFGDYYVIPDKINDLSTNWMFMYYLNKNKKLTETQLTILCTVLINRTWGTLLYFFKNKIKILKIKRNIFFFFPDYFSLYSMIFLISKKYNWKLDQLTVIIIVASIIKNIQEFLLHVKNVK